KRPLPPVESRNCSPRNRRHGRPRDASENHSPMDGASEGQATDGRSGRGLRQKGRRAEQVSAQQPRAVRQNHGMAVVARRQVITGPPGRSEERFSPLARSVERHSGKCGVVGLASSNVGHFLFLCVGLRVSSRQPQGSFFLEGILHDRMHKSRPITLVKPITMPLTCGWPSANLPLVSAPLMSAAQPYYQEKTRADDLAYHFEPHHAAGRCGGTLSAPLA